MNGHSVDTVSVDINTWLSGSVGGQSIIYLQHIKQEGSLSKHSTTFTFISQVLFGFIVVVVLSLAYRVKLHRFQGTLWVFIKSLRK